MLFSVLFLVLAAVHQVATAPNPHGNSKRDGLPTTKGCYTEWCMNDMLPLCDSSTDALAVGSSKELSFLLGKRGNNWWNNFKVYAGKQSSRLSQAIKSAFDRARSGSSSPNGGQGHGNDGTVFHNNEGILPANDVYTEWGIESNRGWGCSFTNNQRLVVGSRSRTAYYTPDHYKTFQVVPRKYLD